MNGFRTVAWAAVGAAVIGAVGAGAFGMLEVESPRAVPPRGAIGGATYAPVIRHAHRALVVTSLRTGGAEANAGLRVGDMVEAVNGQNGASLVTLRAAEVRARSGAVPMVLRVNRKGDAATTILLREAPGGAI